MSPFRSLSKALTQTFNFITNTVESAEKLVDSGNVVVSNFHKETVKTSTTNSIMRIARHHEEHVEELNANPTLKTIYEKLEKEWDTIGTKNTPTE